MSEMTLILESMRHGHSSEELLPLIYDELRRLALARLSREAEGQTLQATALVHEAWLRMVDVRARTWENRAQFLGAAAVAMRRIMIDNARRKARFKRGGHLKRVDEIEIQDPSAITDERLLRIDEALERMSAVHPEKARMVTLKFFGGLTNREVAEVMGITERTVERHWVFAKTWLYQTILCRA